MTKEFIKEYFNSDFKGIESLKNEILIPVFGDLEDGWTEITDNLPSEKQAKEANIKRIRHAATLWAAGRKIRVFDVTLYDNCHIHSSRKGIQTLIRKYVGHFQGALIAFHYENPEGRSWRLSYLEKQDSNANSTSAKRYTYLCGRDYPCRTIAERFSILAEQEKTDMNLEAAFSVEALSEEFFTGYRLIYRDFCDYLTKNRNNTNLFGEEFATCDEKFIRDYVKKMMGRITFLHFLQRKGWLGQPRNVDGWGKGDLNFMRHLFEKASDEQKENFLDEVLEPIFFECLNEKRDGDFFDTQVHGIRLVKIPYLNGGLFEKDEIDKPRSKFPADKFQRLFDFFGQYNFTIDENDPFDTEVGVDPEMLGKIFENLLEDNKDKGAFYTPKEIVNYMCREALVAYLVKEARAKSEVNKRRQENFDALIRRFVADPDLSVNNMRQYDRQQLVDLNDSLKDVKICDPAIGSGAFPMGLLNLLVTCRTAVNDALGIGIPRAELKKQIIRNNIYGVDIEKGAIDIARLRFWLSIVVDLDKPEPLPNFDYKFMQGNSLLEQFAGVDLSDMFATAASSGDGVGVQFIAFDEVSTSQTILLERLRHYFEMREDENKHALREDVNSAVADLIRAKVNESPEIVKQIQSLNVSANERFFLWHTWFSEVFNRTGKQGFDIVIGNPPYGATLTDYDKALLKKQYHTAQTIKNIQKGSLDTFSLFIELGYNLLRRDGSFAMIVPLAFISSDAMSGVHRLLLENCEPIRLSSYAVRPEPVFKNAVVDTTIVLFQKTGSPCQHIYSTRLNRKKGSDFSLQKLIDNLQFAEVHDLLMFGRIPKIGSDIECDILKKIRACKTIGSYKQDNGKPIYYRAAGGRYFKVVTNYTTNSSAEKCLLLDKDYADVIGCILSSSLSFWFYQIYSDNHNWKGGEIESFTVPNMDEETRKKLCNLYKRYLEDIERNANMRTSSGNSTYHVEEFKEYKIVKSKQIIDEIDDTIGKLYGLTDDEIEFVKNYEIEFRMAGDDK